MFSYKKITKQIVMKTLSKILLITFVAAGLYTLSSCNKEKLTQDELSNLILDESETALSLYNDVAESYNLAGGFLLKESCPPETCPLITFTGDAQTCNYNLVLDYGTDGCDGRHGWNRKGKILINVSGCEQVIVTITFDQFYVNDYLIEGTQTISFNQNNSGNPTITLEINGSVTDPQGNLSTIESTMIREWIQGYDTPFNFSDDVFSTTGSVSGVCSEGVAYNMSITSPLIKSMDCKWIQTGEVSIVYGDNTIVKNYGDGTCDSLATITINGETQEIALGPKDGKY
jgi:hypothetical protein